MEESNPHVCFKVEKILGISSDGNYQVQWAPAWVSKFHLVGCEHLIKEFLQEYEKSDHMLSSEQSPTTGDSSAKNSLQTSTSVHGSCDFEKQSELSENGESSGLQEHSGKFQQDAVHSCEGSSGDEEGEGDGANTSNFDTDVIHIKLEDDNSHDSSSALLFMVSNQHGDKNTDVKRIVHHTRREPKESKKFYYCPVCRKQFSSKSFLREHFRSHSGYRPHICQHCNSSFSRASNLNRHLRTHIDERNHDCTYCQKRFTRKDDLVRHIRTHTGYKPFSCNLCEKSFAVKSSLKQHLRVHAGDKPHICELCGKGFATIYKRNKHMGYCSRTMTVD